MVVLRDFPVQIELAELLRGQGADPAHLSSRENVKLMYEEAIAESASLIQPAVVYEICQIREIRHSQTVLGNGHVFRSHLVSSMLGAAREAALVVCTIGGKLEKRVGQYFAERQPAMAIVLDAVGIEAVRQVSERASQVIEAEAAKRGIKASIPVNPSMSPLCSLEEQRVVFEVVPTHKIGVKLSPSWVMVPLKSTSMIIGLGDEVPTREAGSQCDFCSLRETCRQRRGNSRMA